MKDSFRQWAIKSGGNPVAFKDLMNYPVNLAGFVLLALWNTLEGMNLLYPKSISLMLIVNILFDVLLNVYLFCHILRTNPIKQKPYLTALVGWNLIDVGFNFLMVIPNSFLWVMIVRCFMDVVVNTGIIVACYLKPSQNDFVPVVDQLTKYNESIAGTINTTYHPTKEGDGFLSPPNTVVKTIEDMRKAATTKESASVPTVDNIYADKLTDTEYSLYVYADRLYNFASSLIGQRLSKEEATVILEELRVMSQSNRNFDVAFQDVCHLAENMKQGVSTVELPASLLVAKEVKEEYESKL